MGSKIGLVELKTINEDGTLLSRLQMEEQLRKETVYHRRLRAFKLGLPNKVAQHMLPISVTHWLLDQWIQKGTITGEILGIRSEFDADDNKDYLRQLTQRLVQFVEHGLAVKPNPGEGIDMSQFNGPPGFPQMPPMPGTPAHYDPQTMAPQQFVVPPMPGMPPNPGMPFQQQPGAYPTGMPPMPPTQQNFAPQPPQPQQFAPPQPPPQAPQQQAAPTGIPTKAEASRVWGKAGKREDGTERTRRTKEEVSEDAAYEAWCRAGGDPNVGSAPQQTAQPQVAPQQPPPQAPPMMLSPPNPFGNVPGNVPSMTTMLPAPGQFASLPQMPMQQVAPPQPAPSWSMTEEQFNQMMSRLSLIEKGLAQALRVMYQSEGEADLYLVLTKVCRINP